MGLAELLSLKRSKPKPDVPEEKEEQKETEPPKHSDANVVYPFYDAKATSFHPPLSIDASVYTDPKNLTASYSENQEATETPVKNGEPVPRKDEKAKEDKTEDDKKRYSFEYKVCDSKICTKEKCNLETCARDRNSGTQRDLIKTSFNKKSDLEDKIGQEKLTEMINSSIKEAMQTIVKQCRMDKEKSQDKKLKENFDKSICQIKDKYEHRSHQRSRNGLKPSHFREKHSVVPSKRSHEGKKKVKGYEKTANVIEEARSKKRPKLASNVRTDNRKMTGNVNIYICSEANENAQPTKSKKPQQTCTESSSETTTDRSNISSSKLVTCIRNKRRKFKEQSSLDLLAQKNESSENSNASSLVFKSTDSNIATGLQSNDTIVACQDFGKEISEKDTESSFTECECKDSSNSDATIDRSERSYKRSKFVVCDKIEKPCSTIYPLKAPLKSDSEEWSLKSVCSSRNDEYQRDIVLCDRKRESDYSNYRTCNRNKDYEAKRKSMMACRCRKQNRESVGDERCKCGDKRRRLTEKENFMQPLSTCACIAEEEEEEVCVDVVDCQKSAQELMSVCGDVSEGLDKSVTRKSTEELEKERIQPEEEEEVEPAKEERLDKDEKMTEIEKEEKEKKEEKEEKKEKEEKEEKEKEEEKEDSQKMPVSQFTPQKLIRPEVLVLRNLLRQQTKPSSETVDQNKTANQNPNPSTKTNSSKESSNNPNGGQTKAEPAFLKKFNLREQYKFIKRSDAEKGQNPSQKTEDKSSEGNANDEDKGAKTFQERVRTSFLYKSLRKVLEKKQSPERKSEKPSEEDKIGEDTKGNSADRTPEIPKTEVEKDQTTSDSKDTKEKMKLVPRLNVYKMLRTKKSKPESTAVSSRKMVEKDDKNDSESKPAEAIKVEKEKTDSKEETFGDPTEKQEKSKLSTTVIDKKPSAPSMKNIKDTNIEKLKQTMSQKLPEASKEITKKIEPHVPSKDTEIRKKHEDQEKKKPETQKSAVEDESTRNDTHSETPHVQCVRKKSLTKESKQFMGSLCSQIHSSELRTTCVNSKLINCTDINKKFSADSERFDESRCNCCCLPTPQCTDEFINHPKSCLKKERQFRCTNSQEMNTSIICHDKRNWGECGCRRILYCEGCRRPRTDCSCRYTCVSCTNCCKPRSKCSCKSICQGRRSTFCVYCDNPRENCRCRAPLRKCSCCELPTDLCRCEDQRTIRDGRPVLAEQDNDRTMYVTAWKPREEIRRYFSRNLDVPRTESTNECWCCEKLMHHNSDDLPYQRLSVFSDVMDELQQKMSESTCCTRCRTTPCCCNIERERGTDERKMKCCISPKSRRKLVAVCMEKPKVKPPNNYKCDTGKEKSDRQRKIIVSLCCLCKSTPCRCKRSKPIQKKPRAKCYYCKTSPCICIASGDCNKPRPCRCTDSPCRTKEKDNAPRGKISTKTRNNDEKIICVR